MSTLLWSLLFLLAVAMTVAAAQVFTVKAEESARTAKLSPFLTGVVITIFGVALPELCISIFATVLDYSSMVPTYATGANLVNLLLITGVLALLTGTLTLQKETVLKQIPLLLGSTILLLFLGFDGRIDLWEGVVLFIAFLVFAAARRQDYKKGLLEKFERIFSFVRPGTSLPLLILSFIFLLIGSFLSVRGLIEISEIQNWNPGYLASSVLALAVSVPEMLLAYRAVKKGNTDLAMGTLVASCILNTTLVLAIPSFVGPLNVLDDVVGFSLMFLLFATILFSFSAFERKWSAPSGALLILLYLVFLIQFLNPLFS